PQQEETVMAHSRNRIQQGSVRLRKRKRGKDVWTIRYRVRSAGGWSERGEVLPRAKSESEDRRGLKRHMREINASNNPQSPAALNFASFALGPDWQGYLDRRRMKPSTRDVYKSMLNSIVLPAFADLPVSDIAPQDISRLLGRLEAEGSSPAY